VNVLKFVLKFVLYRHFPIYSYCNQTVKCVYMYIGFSLNVHSSHINIDLLYHIYTGIFN